MCIFYAKKKIFLYQNFSWFLSELIDLASIINLMNNKLRLRLIGSDVLFIL